MSWEKDLFKLAFKLNQSDEDVSKVDKILAKHRPEFFYKYREVNKYSLNILKNDLFWFASIDSVNDPYDCYFKYDEHKIKFIELSKDKIQHIYQDEFLMCSLSCNNSSIAMWSHYAHNHEGICIEISGGINSFNMNQIFPVLYTNNIIDITGYLLKSYKYNHGEINLEKDTYLKKILLTKSKEWKYEQEWRCFLPQDEPKTQGVPQKLGPITKVFLGYKISLENEARVINICDARHIPVYRMKPSDTEYKMVSEGPINPYKSSSETSSSPDISFGSRVSRRAER